MKNKSDWLFEVKVGVVALVSSLVYFGLTYTIHAKGKLSTSYNSISPSLLPRVIGILSIAVSLMILVPAILKYLKARTASEQPPKETHPPIFTKDRLIILASLVVYLLIIKYVGYILDTILLVFFVLNYLEREHWVRNTIYAIVFPVVCYYIFNNLLSIWLPAGKIFSGLFG